jgi:hypothetical protein
MAERVRQHCDDQHQPWPARSRFARYVGIGGSGG